MGSKIFEQELNQKDKLQILNNLSGIEEGGYDEDDTSNSQYRI